jgi:precorrin-6B methylase 1
VQVIGMGMDAGALGHAARTALEQAELIIGARRIWPLSRNWRRKSIRIPVR